MTSEREKQSIENKALFALAREERRAMQSDPTRVVLDPYRKQDNLPPGVTSGHILRRKRGDKSDSQCIEEICELVGSGITAKAAVFHVGVPPATWNVWRRENHENCRVRYDQAVIHFLEVAADDSIQIMVDLKNDRDKFRDIHNAELENYAIDYARWKHEDKETRGPAPPEPVYAGPTIEDLRIAKARVADLRWQLEARTAEFAKRTRTDMRTTNVNVNLNQTIDLPADVTADEAMAAYRRLVENRED